MSLDQFAKGWMIGRILHDPEAYGRIRPWALRTVGFVDCPMCRDTHEASQFCRPPVWAQNAPASAASASAPARRSVIRASKPLTIDMMRGEIPRCSWWKLMGHETSNVRDSDA